MRVCTWFNGMEDLIPKMLQTDFLESKFMPECLTCHEPDELMLTTSVFIKRPTMPPFILIYCGSCGNEWVYEDGEIIPFDAWAICQDYPDV